MTSENARPFMQRIGRAKWGNPWQQRTDLRRMAAEAAVPDPIELSDQLDREGRPPTDTAGATTTLTNGYPG